MQNKHARKVATDTTAHIASKHAGKGLLPPSPATPGTAQDFLSSGAGQSINTASIQQVASYPPRNSGNPGNN